MKWCNGCQSHKGLSEFSKNRRTRDGLDTQCKACVRARGKAWYNKPGNKERNKERNYAWLAENPGKAAEYCRKWKEKNPEKMAAAQQSWYLANRERKSEYSRTRRLNNIEAFRRKEALNAAKHRPARLAKCKRWRLANPAAIAAHAAKRRAARIERTPTWLTEAQHQEIAAFYQVAQLFTGTTGIEYHVDHIVPLRGKTVSGLHVPWNLQVIPAVENLRKNNKFVGVAA